MGSIEREHWWSCCSRSPPQAAAEKVYRVGLLSNGRMTTSWRGELLGILNAPYSLSRVRARTSPLSFLFHGRLNVQMRLPSSVLGPVVTPPWFRHRPPFNSSRRMQGVPWRVFAPHRGLWNP